MARTSLMVNIKALFAVSPNKLLYTRPLAASKARSIAARASASVGAALRTGAGALRAGAGALRTGAGAALRAPAPAAAAPLTLLHLPAGLTSHPAPAALLLAHLPFLLNAQGPLCPPLIFLILLRYVLDAPDTNLHCPFASLI